MISILSEDVMMVLVTYQALSRVSRFSLTAKALCASWLLSNHWEVYPITDTKVVHYVMKFCY